MQDIKKFKLHVFPVRIVSIAFCAIVLTICFSAASIAITDSMMKLLRAVTGITDDDVRTATAAGRKSLFDAYALAVYRTERLAIEGENSVQSQARKEQNINLFLPRLSIRGTLPWPMANTKKYLYPSQMAMITLYARQPIMTGLNEAAQIKSSVSDVKLSKMELYNSAGSLLMDVALAYYAALQVEDSLKNNEQILDLYRKTLVEINRRVSIGRSRQSELLRTNAQVFKLEADIKSLRNNLSHARINLANLTGMENEFSLSDTTSIGEPEYSLDDARKLAEQRWDVRSAKERIELARAGMLAAYGSHLPSAYVEGSYVLYHQKTPVAASQYLNPSSLYTSPKWSKYGNGLSIGFGFEIPILGDDITFAKVRGAHSVMRQAEMGHSQALRMGRQDIIDAYQTWNSSKKELEAFRKALASAEENYRVVTAEYRLNLVTILDVLTTLTSLQVARDDHERALLQCKLNRVRLGIAANEFSGDNVRKLVSAAK